MKITNHRTRVKLAVSIMAICLFFISACAAPQMTTNAAATSPVPDLPTKTPAPTLSPTLTPTLTLAETPIDLEKYHSLPSSYDYLIAHPDEFIQVPDPVTEKNDFDRWFTGQLVPVIGPRQEREVNLEVDALGQSGGMYSAWPNTKSVPEGQLGFFYFINSGTTYPVIVINVSRFDPKEVDQTFCIGFLGGSWAPLPYIDDALKLLSENGGIKQIDLISSTSVELLSGFQVNATTASIINSVGDTWFNYPDNIAFGMGDLYVMK